MQKLTFLFLLLAPGFLLGQPSSYLYFQQGETRHVLAENVNVRSGPGTDEPIVATLPIGHEVTTLEKSDVPIEIRGIPAPWIKIAFSQNGKQEEAWIWQGLLATAHFESKAFPDLHFYFGPDKMVEEDYVSALHFQIRAVLKEKQIAKMSFPAVGNLEAGAYWEFFGNRGVSGIDNVFNIGFAAEYCAGPAGDVIVFWDGESFHHVKTLHSGSDAPVFQTEHMIFPEDEGGRKDRLILVHRAGESTEKGEELEEHWEETYLWTAKGLSKISR